MNVGIACAADTVLARDNWLLLSAFTGRGHTARIVVWDDAVDLPSAWQGFDVVVVRTCWAPLFLEWVTRISNETLLLNPPEVVQWAAQKRYMDELAQRGVPAVPTVVVRRGQPSAVAVHAVVSARWAEALVRAAFPGPALPAEAASEAVAAGGGYDDAAPVLVSANVAQHEETAALVAQRIDILRARVGDVVVQPLLRNVLREGELSFVFIGGIFCHCVRRRSAASMLMLPQRPGQSLRPTADAVVPSDDELFFAVNAYAAVAAAIRDGCGVDVAPVFARIDVAREDSGRLLVRDVELIDPALHLDLCDDSAQSFVDAAMVYVARMRTKQQQQQQAQEQAAIVAAAAAAASASTAAAEGLSSSAPTLPSPLGSPTVASTPPSASSPIAPIGVPPPACPAPSAADAAREAAEDMHSPT